jgi:hypothetical protein
LVNEEHSENFSTVSSPYNLFKYAVRTEITRRYYERRIRTFFDFIGFMVGSVIVDRCNSFSEESKQANEWATNSAQFFSTAETDATFYEKFYMYMTKDTFTAMKVN